jgi:integrase
MPVLKAWLSSHEKKVGRVCPDYIRLNNLTRKFGSICKKAGVEVKQNGFRHSFAAYRLATIKSAAQVALEMGNSPQKLFTNYRELVGEDDAKEWFGLTPSSVKKPKAPEKKPASPKAAKSPKLRSKAPTR